jgi:hypothetical protein
MTQRSPCCVPGCRRTTKGSHEWVCGNHWPAVPKAWRRRLALIRRRYRKQFGDNAWHVYPAGSPDRLAAVRLYRLWDKMWDRCKRAAIERALGI